MLTLGCLLHGALGDAASIFDAPSGRTTDRRRRCGPIKMPPRAFSDLREDLPGAKDWSLIKEEHGTNNFGRYGGRRLAGIQKVVQRTPERALVLPLVKMPTKAPQRPATPGSRWLGVSHLSLPLELRSPIDGCCPNGGTLRVPNVFSGTKHMIESKRDANSAGSTQGKLVYMGPVRCGVTKASCFLTEGWPFATGEQEIIAQVSTGRRRSS